MTGVDPDNFENFRHISEFATKEELPNQTEKGIFDCTDLEKRSDKTEDKVIFAMIQGEIRAKQRLKAELEKIIDEIKMYSEDEEDNHFEWVYVQELKKKLGISHEEKK